MSKVPGQYPGMPIRNFGIVAVILVLFAANLPQALELEVVGKNGEILFQQTVQTSVPSTIGQATVDVFESNHVPYQGSEAGISAIFNLGSDIEVVSDSEMKAYGWCFSLDGVVPETMSDQTPLIMSDSKIRWFYAFARYRGNAWISQCETDGP